MQANVYKTLRVLTRPSRSGQSIIIIALGFIALIAFVGIATDTAMLFVRYSTLRRAVDAAAIAAAGAVRQSTSSSGFAAVAASAEQYIKIHGLDPTSVRVDTCATEVYDAMIKAGEVNLTDPTLQRTYTNTLAAKVGEQLCTINPEKLVRVSAQVKSPTTFLSLIGYNTITLSASSVSQTAVLDVALLLDASYSEGYDTASAAKTFYANNGTLNNFTDFMNLWPASDTQHAYDPTNLNGAAVGGTHPLGSIRAECRGASTSHSGNFGYGGCCNEPVTMSNPTSASVATTWYIGLNGAINTAHVVSGENPESANDNTLRGKNYSALICKPFKYVRDSARNFLNNVNFAQGDRAFLVVFDSAIHQLTSGGDYNSPDDVATATLPVFTSSAPAIQALNKYAGLEVAPSGFDAGTGAGGRCVAQSSYAPPYNISQRHANNQILGTDTVAPYPSTMSSTVFEALYETTAPCQDTNTGGAILAAQGVITNAAWIRRTAVWVMVLLSDGYPNRTPGLTAVSGLGGSPAIGGVNSYGGFHRIGDPNYNPAASAYPNFFTNYPPVTGGVVTSGVNPLQVSALARQALIDPGFCPWYTFCDPTSGNYPSWQTGQVFTPSSANTLLDKNGSSLAYTMYPDGYVDQVLIDGQGNKSVASVRVPDPNTAAPVPNAMSYNAQYCPQTEIETDPIWWNADGLGAATPYWKSDPGSHVACTATDPDIRHFCMDTQTGTINPSDTAKCSLHYDPKDYARDMVDYAALTDYTTTVKGNSIAMYSIFFPHQTKKADGSIPDIGSYILGVKFMRYVADAGSDGTIKNHVQAWFRQHNAQTDPIPPDYYSANPYDGASSSYPSTTEDACAKYDFRELNTYNQAGQHGPISLPDYPNGTGYEDVYRTSCGNYYFADSADSINRAFTDIAGKLFTRLSQ